MLEAIRFSSSFFAETLKHFKSYLASFNGAHTARLHIQGTEERLSLAVRYLLSPKSQDRGHPSFSIQTCTIPTNWNILFFFKYEFWLLELAVCLNSVHPAPQYEESRQLHLLISIFSNPPGLILRVLKISRVPVIRCWYVHRSRVMWR